MDFYPTIVTLELTNECNLRCKHCYAYAGERLENELTYEEIKRLLRALHDAGTMEIELSGGEPLLRPDLMKIINAAQSLDFEITLITNGILIKKETAKKLSDFSIKHVQISLDGLKEAHEYIRGKGTFESTVRAIKELRDEDIKVAVRTTATKKSLNDINGIVDLAVQLGVYRFGFFRFFPAGRGMAYKEELMLNANEMLNLHRTIKNIYEDYGNKIEIIADPCGFFEGEGFKKLSKKRNMLCPCPGGKTWCLIKSNGIVSSCDVITTYAGNVREQKFGDIWEKAPIFKVFREFDPELLKGTCSSCKHKNVCSGYCRALAFLYTGDFYSEDPTCYHVLKQKDVD